MSSSSLLDLGLVLRHALVGRPLVRRPVHHEASVALEHLAREHLGEHVRRVGLRGDVLDHDGAGAAKLPHLEQLAVDVTRVLSRSEAVAQVVGALVVGARLDGLLGLVAAELNEVLDVDQLDREVGGELKLAWAHSPSVLGCCSV